MTYLSRNKLAQQCEDLRERGERIVFTNGCFDILHVGHVRYLRQARSRGDALVVGINSDTSVRRLKGHDRPLVPQADRAEVLDALQDVDFVSIFDEDTAVELISVVRPHLYVKGGDYSALPGSVRYPVEASTVEKWNGSLEIIPFIPGHSSSGLIARLTDESRAGQSAF